MSAFKRFREDLSSAERPVDGMSSTYVHRKLDEAEVRMLKAFDAWRAEVGAVVLGLQFGRVASRDVSGAFFVWLDVLHESPAP